MTLAELARMLVELFDKHNIPYMFVGSIASSFHGEPRTTRDLDVVIDPRRASLAGLVSDFEGAGFYADQAAADDALAHRSQFNVIDPESGWKADLIIRPDDPFSREEFARRQHVDLLGVSASVATAEDTIISKLKWARAGASERQLRDVASILATSGDQLDRGYLDRWIRELGLQDEWQEARKV